MAILDVLHFPDPRLRKVASPIEAFPASVQTLAQDMLDTMYDQNGIGLAATQVNIHVQMLVLDVTEDKSGPIWFINPELVSAEGEKEFDEGCLSVPGESAIVKRPDIVEVKAFDQFGKPFTKKCDGLMSVCLQHEMDHLKGKLFLDYLSPLKRDRIEKRLIKAKKLKSKPAI